MKNLWDRFLALVSKLISVKGLIFCTVSALAILGRVDSDTWLICAGLFAGIRTVEKVIGSKKIPGGIAENNG
jgi:hypothetical protein